MAIVWTYITANEIVNLIQTFGVILNVNNVIMGLTFLAWGNSIADVVADVTLARQGFPRMSLSACIGGPLFSILFQFCVSPVKSLKMFNPLLACCSYSAKCRNREVIFPFNGLYALGF